MKTTHTLIAAALISTLSLIASQSHAAELPTLPAQRITDGAIRGDHKTISALQGRLNALNDTGKWQVDEYHFAKAQCWLDFAFSEYHENDRGSVTEQALFHARELIQGMEGDGQFNESLIKTIPQANTVRQDLWNKLEGFKNHKDFPRCASAVTGCLEVQLNWAGHEYKQFGWRAASPKIGIAEDMVATGQHQLDNCPQPEAPKVVQPAPVVPQPIIKQICTEKINLSADALFKFDRSDLGNMLPAGKAELDALAAKLKGIESLKTIQVIGHTDRKGSMAYNIPLSQRRAATVKAYLAGQGIDGDKMLTSGVAFTQPVKECSTALPRQAEIDCLQPNRRVEVIIQSEGSCTE